jgi:L-alanine-DL-glutamate epimerase-like enolase superfamily enzyme
VWPGAISYAVRYEALCDLISRLTRVWAQLDHWGHPVEIWTAFESEVLERVLAAANADAPDRAPIPWLAALLCCSAFDIALHDAYGRLHGVSCWQTYSAQYMSQDLYTLMGSEASAGPLRGRFPDEFLTLPRSEHLVAWHLVGGLDRLEAEHLIGDEPDDGYPVLLGDWIARDGLRCLKVKLRGNDPAWDYQRLVHVGQIGLEAGVLWLSADYNCTVTDPAYVTDMLDRLLLDEPEVYAHLLYVEQPFPYDLIAHQIDVHSVSARKPLFMDESAHDWRLVKLGRELGWTGVALKTCKTLSGALLSLAWAKAHGMTLMVQDLTNPILAQIPHVLLAAHAGTIMGVETNAMQFYPEASRPEGEVHPGLYRRHEGVVTLETIQGTGMGYRLDEIRRTLPDPVISIGQVD